MAKTTAQQMTASKTDGFGARITGYLRETRAELRKVSWPTREEATNLTLIVLGVTAVMAVFLGAIDFVFSTLIRLIVS